MTDNAPIILSSCNLRNVFALSSSFAHAEAVGYVLRFCLRAAVRWGQGLEQVLGKVRPSGSDGFASRSRR
jgi:hypothetical protein